MNPSPEYLARLRVAIATDQGITEQHECPCCRLYRGQGHASFCSYLPDYPASRDAIMEAILRRMKTKEEQLLFTDHLEEILLQEPQYHVTWAFSFATSTALQLATAYARAASLDVKP